MYSPTTCFSFNQLRFSAQATSDPLPHWKIYGQQYIRFSSHSRICQKLLISGFMLSFPSCTEVNNWFAQVHVGNSFLLEHGEERMLLIRYEEWWQLLCEDPLQLRMLVDRFGPQWQQHLDHTLAVLVVAPELCLPPSNHMFCSIVVSSMFCSSATSISMICMNLLKHSIFVSWNGRGMYMHETSVWAHMYDTHTHTHGKPRQV